MDDSVHPIDPLSRELLNDGGPDAPGAPFGLTASVSRKSVEGKGRDLGSVVLKRVDSGGGFYPGLGGGLNWVLKLRETLE